MRNTIESLQNSPVIAVIRRPPQDKMLDIAEALLAGGVKHMEITMEKPESADLIQQVKEEFGDRALVGAGTVLDEPSAVRAIHTGADFIFSPNLNCDVVRAAKRYGVTSIPGVMTPTEVVSAYEAGADVVKIFPAATLGPGYLKELKGPLPHIPMIPTGGVNASNIQEFIDNGAVAVGVGGSLMDKQAIEEGNLEKLTQNAKTLFSGLR
ncbi:bifunctional 4-hydroxy-2-oxoglutarate aldolase/2-dehydro-3-deoxy-phosphogluconate aldolase [Alteribacillus bidgolensis]|uniref:2-keto-3-deoxy-phosphogluconate aldolase n=1 Tax=Alteribacillus bidgolensis TaxID=930129 RepID=A0A1G8EB87_9BACI|nr:bifunctional 4-hydroxy-2-oxoglutarate aldolase/2-dehydro-3-deoxy-phosphogluconate aldolase [Alteribacillus bidgolensis]SDH66949.1 2-keto-3-deoxy-phosphogluconate aldolase [Alteribacillus bidgolensis]